MDHRITLRQWLSGAVHLFTALGIVCALMAADAALQARWETVFLWLGLAFLIDGIDGTFARLVGVKMHLPRFSGEQLDLVVDYVTYVFVPVLVLQRSGYLTGPGGLLLAALILLSSLYHFSDTESKAPDYSFVGFPAIWNIVAFYVMALAMPGWLAVLIIVSCVVLTFIPWRWVHPLRVQRAFGLTVSLTVLWSLAASVVVMTGFPAKGWTWLVLVLIGIYGIALVLYARFGKISS